MPAHSFSHYNLRAPRAMLIELRDFYCEVVGLTDGPRPPFRSYGFWLYAGTQDVLHLSESGPDENRTQGVAGTFDHAAFSCTGCKDYEALLQRRGIPFEMAEVPATRRVQIFFSDPAGNGVELNFPMEDAV